MTTARAGDLVTGAVPVFCVRVVYAGAVVLLSMFDGPVAVALMVSGVGALQLGASLASFWRERRTTDLLYADIGVRLTDVDAMRAIPLPALDPEIAVARGIRARARLSATLLPNLYGDAAAFIAVAVFVLASELRSALLPAIAGAVLAVPTHIALSRASQRAQDRAHEAWIALYTHLSAFLAERQERLARGGRRRFLSELATRVNEERRRALAASVAASLLRRAPLALALAGALGTVLVFRVDVPYTPAVAWLLGCLLASGNAVASALAERARLTAEARELEQLLSLAVTAPHDGEAPGACAKIEVDGVSFSYVEDARVFLPVSFTAARGTITVLRGKNGSGKSTLMRLLAGLGPATEGELRIDGVPLGKLSLDRYRERVAFVPQTTQLDARATVREILREGGAEEQGMTRVLSAVGFDDDATLLDTPVGNLSGGRRRRVQLARALSTRPAVLLMDEPEAGLDEVSTRRLCAHLTEVAREAVVVVATHQHAFEGNDVLLEPPP